MQIKYGINNINIDVTNICFNKLFQNNIITIPSGDHNRAYYFTDPIVGVLKKIYIIIDNNTTEYDHTQTIKIDITTQTITTQTTQAIINDIDNKISQLHSKLKLNYGSFTDELPEQKMVLRYLTGREKVLEIGSNIGRNSLIIASIIDNNNFLTLESDTSIFNQLNKNKNINNFTFYTENSALSTLKLIQKGWETMVSDNLLPDYKWVNTITLKNLYAKYNIQFDTLVLDCEGAFYYILMDFPEILNNIKLIIMENDYHDISHKNYINNVLKNNNFYVDYVEGGGWGPCYNNFYEVWKK
jgi:FkbM family methyltransferase